MMRRFLVAGALLCCASAVRAQTGTAVPEKFEIVDLGTFGGAQAEAVAIDAEGRVACVRKDEKDLESGFVWQGNRVVTLAAPAGGGAIPRAIGAGGDVAGSTGTKAGPSHACVWRRRLDGGYGPPIDLGTLGGSKSDAYGMNASGVVVGESLDADGRSRAFRWEKGAMIALGTVGGREARAQAINAAGIVVGWSDDARPTHQFACRWEDGTALDLGPPEANGSTARAINDAGAIVGRFVSLGAAGGACLWTGGRAALLDGSGARDAEASAINGGGVIVGRAYVSNGRPDRHACFWSTAPGGAIGEPVDLGTLGGRESEALAINDSGTIAGWARTADGEQHACLWRPRIGDK